MSLLSRDIHNRLSKLEDIYTSLRLNGITFSKNESMKIVGSRRTLEHLVAAGKIRTKNIPCEKFRRWECLAEDVLRYANYKNQRGISY